MIVGTKSGKVEGYPENGMIAFKGIPFAQPPVGELRFKPPVPVAPWDGVFKAREFGKRSLQTEEQGYCDNIGFSEDCLNLNIYTPDTEGSMPVLVDIHGGAFQNGSNQDHTPDKVAEDRNFVYVNLNYRLGIVGYMYLEHILGPE